MWWLRDAVVGGCPLGTTDRVRLHAARTGCTTLGHSPPVLLGEGPPISGQRWSHLGCDFAGGSRAFLQALFEATGRAQRCRETPFRFRIRPATAREGCQQLLLRVRRCRARYLRHPVSTRSSCSPTAGMPGVRFPVGFGGTKQHKLLAILRDLPGVAAGLDDSVPGLAAFIRAHGGGRLDRQGMAS